MEKHLSKIGKERISLASPSKQTDEEILINVDIERDIGNRLQTIMQLISKLRGGHQHMTVVLADMNTRLQMTKKELDKIVTDNKELYEQYGVVQQKLSSIQAQKSSAMDYMNQICQ